MLPPLLHPPPSSPSHQGSGTAEIREWHEAQIADSLYLVLGGGWRERTAGKVGASVLRSDSVPSET